MASILLLCCKFGDLRLPKSTVPMYGRDRSGPGSKSHMLSMSCHLGEGLGEEEAEPSMSTKKQGESSRIEMVSPDPQAKNSRDTSCDSQDKPSGLYCWDV